MEALLPSLLDEIIELDRGILATVVQTRGETYKSVGHKALFGPDSPIPRWGNIGTGCFDQAITRIGKDVLEAGAPQIVEFDLSEPTDIHFGSGNFCGGYLEILLEAVLPSQQDVYRRIRDRRLEIDEEHYLVHHLEEGRLEFTPREPESDDSIFVEPVGSIDRLVIFGATPLARQLVGVLDGLALHPVVCDWREAYLAEFERMVSRPVELSMEVPIDDRSLVLVLSHRYARDREILRRALQIESPYVGMLSSESRRDSMLEELRADGVDAGALDRVRSPVGLPIGAESDREIAISIAAELVRHLS